MKTAKTEFSKIELITIAEGLLMLANEHKLDASNSLRAEDMKTFQAYRDSESKCRELASYVSDLASEILF